MGALAGQQTGQLTGGGRGQGPRRNQAPAQQAACACAWACPSPALGPGPASPRASQEPGAAGEILRGAAQGLARGSWLTTRGLRIPSPPHRGALGSWGLRGPWGLRIPSPPHGGALRAMSPGQESSHSKRPSNRPRPFVQPLTHCNRNQCPITYQLLNSSSRCQRSDVPPKRGSLEPN